MGNIRTKQKQFLINMKTIEEIKAAIAAKFTSWNISPHDRYERIQEIYAEMGGEFYPAPIHDPIDDELWNAIEKEVNHQRMQSNPDITKSHMLVRLGRMAKAQSKPLGVFIRKEDKRDMVSKLFVSFGGELGGEYAPAAGWEALWKNVESVYAECYEDYKHPTTVSVEAFESLVKEVFGNDTDIISAGQMTNEAVRELLGYVNDFHRMKLEQKSREFLSCRFIE